MKAGKKRPRRKCLCGTDLFFRVMAGLHFFIRNKYYLCILKSVSI